MLNKGSLFTKWCWEIWGSADLFSELLRCLLLINVKVRSLMASKLSVLKFSNGFFKQSIFKLSWCTCRSWLSVAEQNSVGILRVHCPFACWRTLRWSYVHMLPGRSMLSWAFLCKFYADMIFILQMKHWAWVSGLCGQQAFPPHRKKLSLFSRNLALPPSFTWVCLICLRLCAFFLDTWILQHLEEYRTDVRPAWASWTIITETLAFGHPYWPWALVEPIRRKARQDSPYVLMHRMMMDLCNGWG